jgi:hypothetical protein
MIQRIQSVYFLLTSVLSLLFLRGPFLTFIDNSGASISLTISGAVISGNEKIATYIILPVLAVIVPLMAVVIILLFRKRQLQIKLTGILVAMEIGFIAASAICVLLILSKNDASIASWSKPLIPLVQIVLTLLALRAIRKDEDLVKSYDRIR